LADVRGGSFGDVSSLREDARPVVCDFSRGVRGGETARHARQKPNQIKRHRFNRGVQSRHAPSRPLAWCSATAIELPRPCRAISFSFLPAFLARRRSWGFGPSQVFSRRRVARHFCRAGPTCPSHHASAPIDFRRGDRPPDGMRFKRRSAWDLVVGVAWTSGLRSRLRSDQRLRSRRSILPWALPLAGFRAHFSASDQARPRSHHQPPGNLFRLLRNENPYPLMGLSNPSAY
jgi:hypothetical protein